ncbi:MAG: energy transducer TonB [Bacteroidales bacterium]|jgi:TonB family protein|nr:energy transducer TonB [Bacteroidales bacterium]MDD2203958.1 energy transducer TonB [Bacteroidales bacterium]MDD3152104.1 energy transducer TonB [Bacteroidales bacterium]MDD3913453.1 energy transducer TonB [Bacteroidales bacterium]MDD4633249.1 energy transducer TonB [Bacteroidales bacterium]
MSKKQKSFIKLPEYPGGKKAFQEFIRTNLKYPEDAIRDGVEGTVTVEYEINDDGDVVSAKVIHKLCPSCDEEALRLIRMLKFGNVLNRGFRVKKTNKTTINFALRNTGKMPDNNVRICYLKPEEKSKEEKKSKTYNYSITLK